jgi:CspA family cold shock protein
MNGKVKFFDPKRGFGFIACDTNSIEYFVHESGLKDAIQKDAIVTFDIVKGQRGPKAINVKLVDS